VSGACLDKREREREGWLNLLETKSGDLNIFPWLHYPISSRAPDCCFLEACLVRDGA
jgi:hypothetical protein